MNRRGILQAGIGAMIGMGCYNPTAASIDGYIVPAEENRHQRTFMQWPTSRKVYRSKRFLKHVQRTIANVANTISEFEPVVMLAGSQDHANAQRLLGRGVELWDIPTEDLWARDSGPIFGQNANGDLAIRHIQFNGWGNKQIHHYDGKIAQRLAERLNLPVLPTSLKGEAGGIEQDGHGTLLAHESSWVIRNRNPGMSRAEIELELLRAYGARRIIWADGLKGQDITDYHIDSLARFTGPNRVLVNLPDRPDLSDPFHQTALATHDVLRAAGLQIEVIPEPIKRRVNSRDFVASYVNYYVCNEAVIAAQFGDKRTDDIAVDALRRHYPGREIVTLNADALGELGGGIHCATHEMPA